CDREEEISLFIPQEYWSLDALLDMKGSKKPLVAKFTGTKDKKLEIHSKEELDRILNDLNGKDFKVDSVKVTERLKKNPLPFTTSTLQQDASSKLNFPTQKTMRIAQQLYEGIDIKGKGTVGLITYLRTDSTRISEEADTNAKEYIAKTYGEAYVGNGNISKKNDKKVQDAHEAIRPTYMENSPASIKDQLSRDQFRLYQLIWNRFIASRMAPAKYENTSVKISAGEYRFSASASKIVFDGYLSVYNINNEKSEGNVMLKSIDEDTQLSLNDFESKQHFTQPPAHYTEASLVKTLEELGIGRPSTYAPTISTIVARRYVVKEKKNLYVTELGEAVNSMMKKAFSSIVDVNFTAMMEGLLDMVEEGKVHWKSIIENFYPDFNIAVKNAEKELEKVDIADEVTDVICDQCGRNMVVKYGPYGKFLACPGFPECRNTKPHFEKVGVPCPICGGEVVLKKTKKGRKYYGCENNPECDFISWQKPSTVKCERCGSYMIEKGKKLVCSNKECGYVCNRPDEEEVSKEVSAK
ncbi:MAG: type I DNA topoisomerase, partial [Anaerostipes faecalis]|nr:type I DNA topoisomerase [Anaerostipes faecalis]